jgi:hypothetical protein
MNIPSGSAVLLVCRLLFDSESTINIRRLSSQTSVPSANSVDTLELDTLSLSSKNRQSIILTAMAAAPQQHH